MMSSEPAVLRVAVAQTAPPPGDPEASRAGLAALAAEAAARGARLMLAPELAITGYGQREAIAAMAEPADGPSARALGAVAREHGIALCYGYAERDGPGEDGALYNSAALIGPDGALLANHRKTHLFSGYETELFRPGERAVTMAEVGGFAVAVLICYEVEFPELVRRAVLEGAELIAVPTATSSYPNPSRFSQMVVAARATENNRFVAYANHAGADGRYSYNGESLIAGPLTEIYALGGAGPELLIADLDKARIAEADAKLPYIRDRRPELYGLE